MANLYKRYRLTIIATVAVILFVAMELHYDLEGNRIWYSTIILFSLSFVFLIDNKIEKLEYTSTTDSLTKLKNHHTFWLDYTCDRMAARSLIFIDVDHFKKFNDTHGHLAGNTMLRAYGTLFNEFFAEVGQAYRFGGEEFAVMLEGVNNKQALQLAETLHKIISEREDLNSVSVGIVSSGYGFKDLHAMFHQVDEALYEAKELRNTVINAGDFENL